MKLTALMENQAQDGLLCEHGLSVHIVFRGKQYLLDTGASDRFIKNADTMGIDLDQVDMAVLSHAHYDHSGGYEAFFACNHHAPAYLRAESRQRCYAKLLCFKKYIGIPPGLLETHAGRVCFVQESAQEIDADVWLIGHRAEGLAARGKRMRMVRKTPQGWRADDFMHEQSLVFCTGDGLVILNSCCHAGVDRVVEEACAALPGRPVRAVVGGFHLMGQGGVRTMGFSPEEVCALAHRLAELGVEKIYTGHCTGAPAYEILHRELGDRVQYFCAGSIVEL